MTDYHLTTDPNNRGRVDSEGRPYIYVRPEAAERSAARAEAAAQARARSWRTLVQGAAVTALAAGLTAAGQGVSAWTGTELVSAEAWATVGTVAGTAALTAAASWLHARLSPPA